MRTFKIIGVVAFLLAGIQAIAIVVLLIGPRQLDGSLNIGRCGGHVVGLCLGLIIGLACFQRGQFTHTTDAALTPAGIIVSCIAVGLVSVSSWIVSFTGLNSEKAQVRDPVEQTSVEQTSESTMDPDDAKLMFTSLDNAKVIWARKERKLQAKLEASPADATVLFDLATTTFNLALYASKESTATVTKAADYLARAIDADPHIVEKSSFQAVATTVFYAGACAYSREENSEASLKLLQRAIEAGWHKFDDLMSEPDLEHLRQSADFATVQEDVRKRFVVSLEPLFHAEHDFAFDFDLVDTEGQRLTRQAYLGKVLLVHVWGTWCPPCCNGIPDLDAAAQNYAEHGFEVVGINDERGSEEAEEEVKFAQDDLGINFPCCLADEQTLSQLPRKFGRPTSIFFNRLGELRVVVTGRLRREELKVIIERLLMDSPTEPDTPNDVNEF